MAQLAVVGIFWLLVGMIEGLGPIDGFQTGAVMIAGPLVCTFVGPPRLATAVLLDCAGIVPPGALGYN